MAVVFTANAVWPCEELPSAPPPPKASVSWVRAIAASLRSPKMNQKIIGAIFSRLFLNTYTKKSALLCAVHAFSYYL